MRYRVLTYALPLIAIVACAPEMVTPPGSSVPEDCEGAQVSRDGIITQGACGGCDSRCWLTTDTPAAGEIVTSGVGQNGDGVPDGYEVFLGRSPITADPPVGPDELYVILPYEGGPVSKDIPPDIGIGIRSADIYFLVDTSSTMGGEIDDLRTSLSATIIPEIQLIIDDAFFGVGEFNDYQMTGAGPYRHLEDITDVVADVQTAINGLSTAANFDYPESGTAALHAIATGEGLPCGQGPATCPAGYLGYPCFRPEAQPIVILFTDDSFHNGVADTLDTDGMTMSSCYEYGSGGCDAQTCFPLSPACPSLETVVGELTAIGAKVIGVWSGAWPGSTGQVSTWTWGRTYPNFDEVIDLYYTVAETDSFDSGGSAFLYGINTDGTGLGTEVVDAVDNLVSTMLLDVSSTWFDANPLAPDTSVLVEDVDPTFCDGCASMNSTTNTAFDVFPGSNVIFTATFENSTGEIPAAVASQEYEVQIQLLGNGATVLAERTVHVLVPGTSAASVAVTEGWYRHDYDAQFTCLPAETPLWSRLYFDITDPSGNHVAFNAQTADDIPGLDAAPNVPLPFGAGATSVDIQAALLGAGEPTSRRYLRVNVVLTSDTPGETPFFHDMTVEHFCL